MGSLLSAHDSAAASCQLWQDTESVFLYLSVKVNIFLL